MAAATGAHGQADLTGDGRIEVAFGSPESASLAILNGTSGQELWRVTDTYMFGWAATAHPDIDGDGLADVVVTSPGADETSVGKVMALRGGDGTALWTCTFGNPVARFGLGLGVIPDQDSDKVPDLLIAMLSNDPSGETAVLVSGKSGRVLATAPGFNGGAAQRRAERTVRLQDQGPGRIGSC